VGGGGGGGALSRTCTRQWSPHGDEGCHASKSHPL